MATLLREFSSNALSAKEGIKEVFDLNSSRAAELKLLLNDPQTVKEIESSFGITLELSGNGLLAEVANAENACLFMLSSEKITDEMKRAAVEFSGMSADEVDKDFERFISKEHDGEIYPEEFKSVFIEFVTDGKCLVNAECVNILENVSERVTLYLLKSNS